MKRRRRDVGPLPRPAASPRRIRASARAASPRPRSAQVDTVSVFLPAADATKYDELLRPRAPGGFDEACAFVQKAAASGARVEVTAVDRPDVSVADVESLARRLGAKDFRTRSWLGD